MIAIEMLPNAAYHWRFTKTVVLGLGTAKAKVDDEQLNPFTGTVSSFLGGQAIFALLPIQ